MPLTKLIAGAITGAVDARRFLQKKKQISFIVRRFESDGAKEQADLLRVLVHYADYKKELPGTAANLKDFVDVYPSLGTTSHQTGSWYATYSHDILRSIDDFQKSIDSGEIETTSQWELELQSLHKRARQSYFCAYANKAKLVCRGSVPIGKGEVLAGVEDARKVMQEWMRLDPIEDEGRIEGDFQENLDRVKQNLLNGLADPDERRLYLGFPQIDDHVIIGPAEENRFVLIGAFSNMGKSSFLDTIVYNAAMQGKRILVVPLECSPMQYWKRLAWLHLDRLPHLNLPSLHHWTTHPEAVTEQHVRNLDILVDDLKNGATLPGKIEVVHASNWDEVLERVNAQEYDVLAIDYLAHLDVEGRDKREGVNQLFKKAQSLSLNYKDHRGLVVISPVQISKQGVKDADEPDEGTSEWGLYNEGAIDWYTDAYRACDVAIGLWRRGILMSGNLTKVHCFKSRTVRFPPFMATRDPRSGYFRQSEEPVVTNGKVQQATPQKRYEERYPRDRFINFAYNN